MYILLAILYEHFIPPLTILTALPLAMIGALVSLWLFGSELNVFSFVGLILLVGLVKKNGIIMIDFAIARRREGVSAHDAILEARSEEHTSELQSLMRISYAVFCLKKKIK